MTWTGQTFSVGQILSAAQMNNLQADITAHANGDAGAPKNQTASYATGSVGQSALGADSVGQSELKDATASKSTAVSADSAGTISLTGGTFAMYTFSATDPIGSDGIIFGNGDQAAGILGFYNTLSASRTAYEDERYFSASPPYNLGDGHCHMFIEVGLNKSGEIVAISVAEDPIWAYHGPTNIKAKYYKDGKGYRLENSVLVDIYEEGITFEEAFIRAHNKEQFVDDFKSGTLKELEITDRIKNMDMDIKKSSFESKEIHKLVYLDMVSDKCARLCELHKQGINLRKIIEDGYILMHQSPLNRYSPEGIEVIDFRWKLTR